MEKNVPEHVRKAHDFDKWKKKFITVFNREKVINFTHLENNLTVDLKLAKVDPIAVNK